ncbi:MAG: glutamate racemase [Alphaproteobacteria bacterium]|nr:glutamate racemase [Alphaproteobacteria bacterium]
MLFTVGVRSIINISMKIGFFDSGLGGLHIAQAVRKALPKYDYVYLGDTLHVPYGKRSRDTIYRLTEKAVEYLFTQHDCKLVIIACNTASALALRKLQQGWLAENYPDRRVLGVIVPTLEHTLDINARRIGLIATEAMCESGIYEEELGKLDPQIELYHQSAPLLVPLLEYEGDEFLTKALDNYLSKLEAYDIDTLILGCTHYCLLKDQAKALLPNVNVVSQDDIIPQKLHQYLQRHIELENLLSCEGAFEIFVTDNSQAFIRSAYNVIDITLERPAINLCNIYG